jgi:hypothetical protein
MRVRYIYVCILTHALARARTHTHTHTHVMCDAGPFGLETPAMVWIHLPWWMHGVPISHAYSLSRTSRRVQSTCVRGCVCTYSRAPAHDTPHSEQARLDLFFARRPNGCKSIIQVCVCGCACGCACACACVYVCVHMYMYTQCSSPTHGKTLNIHLIPHAYSAALQHTFKATLIRMLYHAWLYYGPKT